jgi:hypothetical protein
VSCWEDGREDQLGVLLSCGADPDIKEGNTKVSVLELAEEMGSGDLIGGMRV